MHLFMPLFMKMKIFLLDALKSVPLKLKSRTWNYFTTAISDNIFYQTVDYSDFLFSYLVNSEDKPCISMFGTSFYGMWIVLVHRHVTLIILHQNIFFSTIILSQHKVSKLGELQKHSSFDTVSVSVKIFFASPNFLEVLIITLLPIIARTRMSLSTSVCCMESIYASACISIVINFYDQRCACSVP